MTAAHHTTIHEWTITFSINGKLQTLTIWADSLDTAKDQIEINNPGKEIVFRDQRLERQVPVYLADQVGRVKDIATNQRIRIQQAAISLHGLIRNYINEFEPLGLGYPIQEEDVLADILETYQKIRPDLSDR